MPSVNKTANIGLNQWQANEYPKREDFNADNHAIDEALTERLTKTGDGSDVTVSFTEAGDRASPATGEKLSVMFGKIKKWFSDLADLAFGKCGSTANQALYTTTGGIVTADKLPVAAGGTGAGTAAGARTNLDAAQPYHGEAAIAVADWIGDAAPYTYTLSVAGMTADDNPYIAVIHSSDEDANDLLDEAWTAAKIRAYTTAGAINIVARGDKPTVAIPIFWRGSR